MNEAIKRNSLQAKVDTTIFRSQNVFSSNRKSFHSSSKKSKQNLVGSLSCLSGDWLLVFPSFCLLMFSLFHIFILYGFHIIFPSVFSSCTLCFFLYVSVILFRIRDPLISISAHELTSMTSPQFHFTHNCPSWCLFRW